MSHVISWDGPKVLHYLSGSNLVTIDGFYFLHEKWFFLSGNICTKLKTR